MKIPSTFLYDLVHSLTKSEKRYIKVQAGTSDKDYVQLFEALMAQSIYDEQALLQKYQGAKFLKHLAVNKRYLYELLLQSLARFGNKSVEEKVQDKIRAVNVLIEKGLKAAALSELKKGQKIAETYELFDFQMILSSLRKKLLFGQPSARKKVDFIRQIYDADLELLKQLKNTSEYWHLAQQMVQFQTRYQKIQNETQRNYISNLTTSSLFRDQKLATNFKSRMFFFQANAIYQFMQGDVKEAYKVNSQFLDLLESHPHFLNIYAQRYLATLNNMLIDSLVIGEYQVLKEGIDRLVKTQEQPAFKSIKNIEARVFRQRYLLLINWSLRQKDFKKAMEWIPEIEEGLKKFGGQIEKHHRITFYYLIAYLLFLNGQYEKSLKWNNLIINDPKEDVVKEIFYFARILNLLIHYELGNYTLLESLLLSTPKYLRARRKIYATEKTVFQFLGKIINAITRSDQQKLLAEFKITVELLSEQAEEKRVFNYLNLREWVERSFSG